MTASGLFDLYRQLADTVSKQRIAAFDSDWEVLIALEVDCRKIIEALRRSDPFTDLSFAEKEELMIILSKIAKDQQEVRKISEEGRSQLSALIKSIKTEQKIIQAYGLS
jgi:hypothetical protein